MNAGHEFVPPGCSEAMDVSKVRIFATMNPGSLCWWRYGPTQHRLYFLFYLLRVVAIEAVSHPIGVGGMWGPPCDLLGGELPLWGPCWMNQPGCRCLSLGNLPSEQEAEHWEAGNHECLWRSSCPLKLFSKIWIIIF